MSLIHDIQAAAISQTTDIQTLLRMCKLLAARISHQRFGEWVDQELNGYPSFESLPDYRIVRVDSYGEFFGPYVRVSRLQISVSILPKDLRDQYSYAYMGSSISAYTALLEGDKTGRVEEPWPIGLALHHASKLTPQMQCIAAWKEIPIGAVVRLVDSVKTRVLGFAIDLEREAPNAGDMPIGSRPLLSSEKMTQIFNTNITGNVGNIANSSENFSQTATIQPGNWDSLEQRLISLGLRSADLDGMRAELEVAASSQEQQKKTAVAAGWISRLMTKAIAGASGVGIEVAATGIAKAISEYFGISGA